MAVEEASAAPPLDAPPGSVTTYQQNPLHDGLGVGPLRTPLTQAWSLTLANGDPQDQLVGYPLVVHHRVFVVVANAVGSSEGTRLYALNEQDGSVEWGPVSLAGSFYNNGIAADNDKIFSINFDGLLKAFSQSDGQLIWQKQLPGQFAFTAAPTVVNDAVFVGGSGTGGTIYAVDGSDGAIKWTRPVYSGDDSSPAVFDDGVYVSYSCEVAYRLDANTGAIVWTHSTDCSGGGGNTPVIHTDNVYLRDRIKPSVILKAADGSTQGNFDSYAAPAFDGGLAFYTPSFGDRLGLVGYDLTTNSVRWMHTTEKFVTAPVVIDGKVAMGTQDGTVDLFDESTGSLVWSGNANGLMLTTDDRGGPMLAGMAAADNMLFVPTVSGLTAFRGQFADAVGGAVELAVVRDGATSRAPYAWSVLAIVGVICSAILIRTTRKRPN